MARLSVSLDARLLRRQLDDLAELACLLPKRRAQRFYRKALCLVERLRLSEGSRCTGLPAGDAGDLRLEVRILGMDELIAAAFRAAKRHFPKMDVGHGGSRAK